MRWGENGNYEVTGLHYGYQIVDDQVKTMHFVPASSVRGALRNWTIQHVITRELIGGLTPPPKDDPEKLDAYLETLHKAIDQGNKGYELLFSLFGQVADVEGNTFSANAGRLQVVVQPFDNTNLRDIDSAGVSMKVQDGPDNVRRHMAVRSPLDRITHETKKGGLHHFLEFSRGQEFAVHLSIVNPLPRDVGLISLWRRELNDGFLRIGALSSIGRGRVSVTHEDYHLWRRPTAPEFRGLKHFSECEHILDEDPLAGIWRCYQLNPAATEEFIRDTRVFLGRDNAA
jgi:hypothetical protein